MRRVAATFGVPHNMAPAIAPAAPHATATWREGMLFLDPLGVTLSLASTLINWYLVVRYKTDDNKQSMCNLASLVLGMVSSLLSLPLKHSTWNWFKLSIASVLGFVGIFLDALTYHHHINAILLYVAGWIFFLPIVWLLPYSTIQDLQVVGSVTDLISVLILVLGCLLPPTWEYVRYEAHSAVLEGTSTLCNVFKASGSVNIGLTLAVVSARWLYAGLIHWRTRHQMQGLAPWRSGVQNTTSRHFRTCEQIWTMVRDACAGVPGFLSWVFRSISIRELLAYFYMTTAAGRAASPTIALT